MKNKYRDGTGHHRDNYSDSTGHHQGGRHPHRDGRRGRIFDYGDLRLLLLAMISENSSHGYELIKLVEERMGGSYSPSPGVIYPTLAWLEDVGYAAITPEDGGRKRYSIRPEGEAFLTANRKAVEDLLARAVTEARNASSDIPDPVARAMDNVKLALRTRLRLGSIDEQSSDRIAGALNDAARAIDRC